MPSLLGSVSKNSAAINNKTWLGAFGHSSGVGGRGRRRGGGGGGEGQVTKTLDKTPAEAYDVPAYSLPG